MLELPHAERARWCAEISRINERMNGGRGSDREAQTGGTELADLVDAGNGPRDRTDRTDRREWRTDRSNRPPDADRPDEGTAERDG